MRNALLIVAIFPLLSGCTTVASTAVQVVTLPVKVVSRGVDMATTSQSERDERAGKELRKQDEQRGKQAREMLERCQKGRALPTDVCQPVQPR